MVALNFLTVVDLWSRDISANGAFILGVVDEKIGPHFGTSYSAPIWASIITLVRVSGLRILPS